MLANAFGVCMCVCFASHHGDCFGFSAGSHHSHDTNGVSKNLTMHEKCKISCCTAILRFLAFLKTFQKRLNMQEKCMICRPRRYLPLSCVSSLFSCVFLRLVNYDDYMHEKRKISFDLHHAHSHAFPCIYHAFSCIYHAFSCLYHAFSCILSIIPISDFLMPFSCI